MRVLNLYAGIGGNRHLWSGVEVTAVEHNPKVAEYYSDKYPEDTVIVGDAHEYLLHNAKNFDFIWSSPPCQSHSKMSRTGQNQSQRYPDLRLYEEILFLTHDYMSLTSLEGTWLVENVVPWYEPLILPDGKIGRHLFWSNLDLFGLRDAPEPPNIMQAKKAELVEWLGIPEPPNIYLQTHDPLQCLRNCVHPLIGKDILEKARADT